MKKVFYILNLLFLTLLTFGGSVFAGEPDYYLNENGISTPIPVNTVDQLTSGDTNGGWYYLDDSNSNSNLTVTIGDSSSTNPVNIVVNGPVNLSSGSWINVPENTVVNFYGANEGSILTIQNSYASYVIGNSGNDFGNITFNSGIYTVTNTDSGVPIGSNNSSGGSITVNAAATVNATRVGEGIVIGTAAESQKCTINVAGGLLDCTSGNGQWAFGTSVGTGGQLNVSNQGKILTLTDPTGLDNWTIADSGGIIGYQVEYGTAVWNAVVGGKVSMPVVGNNTGQSLTPPLYAGNQNASSKVPYWSSVTVNPNGNLTLGAVDPDDPDGGFQPADLSISSSTNPVPDGQAVFNNNGIVTVNKINQAGLYPVAWNNNPGSTLTINSDATLGIWKNGFNNSATARIAIEGTLYVSNGGTFQNSGNLSIAEGGSISGLNNNATQVVGIAGIVNNPGGTVELDGTVTLAQAAEFENSGTLDIGPIGQVVTVTQSSGAQNGGQLTNNAGGTVTSQNPCYYGFKCTSLFSSL